MLQKFLDAYQVWSEDIFTSSSQSEIQDGGAPANRVNIVPPPPPWHSSALLYSTTPSTTPTG